MLPRNKKLKSYSRELRKNMTEAEILQWSKLRRQQLDGIHFYRQRIIGDYIVDFYCPLAKLVIELDGNPHFLEEGHESDMIRDDFLRKFDLKVLRFSNSQVIYHLESVLSEIHRNIINAALPVCPPFSKGGN